MPLRGPRLAAALAVVAADSLICLHDRRLWLPTWDTVCLSLPLPTIKLAASRHVAARTTSTSLHHHLASLDHFKQSNFQLCRRDSLKQGQRSSQLSYRRGRRPYRWRTCWAATIIRHKPHIVIGRVFRRNWWYFSTSPITAPYSLRPSTPTNPPASKISQCPPRLLCLSSWRVRRASRSRSELVRRLLRAARLCEPPRFAANIPEGASNFAF